MPTKIISFGFRHGPTIEGQIVHSQDRDPSLRRKVRYIGQALVLDVRGWLPKNPYHDKRLRKLRGTDKAVQDNIRETPHFSEKYQKILDAVRNHPGPVWIGCTGGHHRSVMIAEMLGKDLQVPVTHQDYDKP